jgi:hypothetical protein
MPAPQWTSVDCELEDADVAARVVAVAFELEAPAAAVAVPSPVCVPNP